MNDLAVPATNVLLAAVVSAGDSLTVRAELCVAFGVPALLAVNVMLYIRNRLKEFRRACLYRYDCP